MGLVFTEYIRSLETGSGAPEHQHFAAVWEKLRSAMIAEMKKRGLWNAPPGYLGIHGTASWSDEDAFEEIVADCYAFILDRLPSLRTHLKAKANVEGLFFRCISNFLHDTQKKHDPVGFQVFATLKAALRRLLDDGTLYVLEGNPKISNDTVLGFTPGGIPAPDTDLGAHVEGWSGELLPELVTARGRHRDEVEEQLAALVSCLADRGAPTFRVKDLVDPLKRRVRAGWNAIWTEQEGETVLDGGDGDGEFVETVRLVRPETDIEERQAFGKLLACMSEALERLDASEKVREYHRRLWLFLRNHAAQPGPDKLPSQRRIAKSLGIPRERLSALYATLGSWIEACQATSGNRQLRSQGKERS